MSTPDSPTSRNALPKIRRDGWTGERQLRFLRALSNTRSVTKAAAVAGMSRESAYRLRDRRGGALFAAIWDNALQLSPSAESHVGQLTTRRLMRLLGNHYRQKRGDFRNIGQRRGDHEAR
jgi:hypothetical protein